MFVLDNRQGVCWTAERLLATQEGFSTTELFNDKIYLMRMQACYMRNSAHFTTQWVYFDGFLDVTIKSMSMVVICAVRPCSLVRGYERSSQVTTDKTTRESQPRTIIDISTAVRTSNFCTIPNPQAAKSYCFTYPYVKFRSFGLPSIVFYEALGV
jgi:hypothetical protein